MKNIIKLIMLLGTCMTLGGCPYESRVAIDQPSIKINPALLAKWEHKKENDVYLVTRFDDFTYSIEIVNNSKQKDKLFAFESLIDGVTFINMWEENQAGDSRKYSFYKMELQTDGNLVLSEVTENITEQFASSMEMKRFFAANMKNSYFFGKEKVVLSRQGK
jgi:hypothetical protein